jgi:hypothetical protein
MPWLPVPSFFMDELTVDAQIKVVHGNNRTNIESLWNVNCSVLPTGEISQYQFKIN